MRHGKKFNHLGRTSAHRKAMLSNLASSLILEKRISTTLAKAKELRKYVEPLITKSKDDSTHQRRTVFSYLQNKESVKILFDEVASKIADRPGGYTRIIKTGNRLGDNAETCIIELVDYNDMYTQSKGRSAAKKTRRSRRGSGKSETATVEATEASSSVEAKSDSSENKPSDTAVENKVAKEEKGSADKE